MYIVLIILPLGQGVWWKEDASNLIKNAQSGIVLAARLVIGGTITSQ